MRYLKTFGSHSLLRTASIIKPKEIKKAPIQSFLNKGLLQKVQNVKNKIVCLNRLRDPIIQKKKEKDIKQLKNEKIKKKIDQLSFI